MTSPAPVPKKAILVVNAKSRKGRKLFRHAVVQLREAGVEIISAHPVRNPDKFQEAIRTAVASGAPMVIVGGGDGSLSSSVDYFVGSDCVFALLPLGTANSFARTLGIPLDIDGAIDVIATGQRRRIDLGMIDGDYYANCAAIGVAPLIAETVPHGLKRALGRTGYLMWAAWQMTRFRPFKLMIVEGETSTTIDALEVRIANGSYHGGTKLVEDATLDSGEIVVQAVVGTRSSTLAWSWFSSVVKLRTRRKTYREFRGTALKIITEPCLPISIDGEVLAHTPVMARVAKGVIEVVAPADAPVNRPA